MAMICFLLKSKAKQVELHVGTPFG